MIKFICLFFTLVATGSAQIIVAQNIAINATGAAPDSSAALDVQSTAKGMLIPRMATGQRAAIASPATGLLVFDKTTGSFWFKKKSGWVELVDSTNNTWTKDGPYVSVNNGEYVGIGTPFPDVRLHIDNGTDAGPASGGYFQLGSTALQNLALDRNEIQSRNSFAPADIYIQKSGGNVGIGLQHPPAVKLEIDGGTDIQAVGGGFLQLGAASLANLALDNNEIQARNNDAAAALYLQNNGGNVQIGSASGIAADVHINNGKLLRAETGSANMMPLCYGHVTRTGKLLSGTSNVSIVKSQDRAGVYLINCPGITSSTILIATLANQHTFALSSIVFYNHPGQAEFDVSDSDAFFEFSFVFYSE